MRQRKAVEFPWYKIRTDMVDRKGLKNVVYHIGYYAEEYAPTILTWFRQAFVTLF